MPTDEEMKLIFGAVMILGNCTKYRVTLDGEIISKSDDLKDAAADIVSFMSQEEFYQVVSEGE